jgi:hypothetical protein
MRDVVAGFLRRAAAWVEKRQQDEVIEREALPGLDEEGAQMLSDEELVVPAVPPPSPPPLRGSLASRMRGLG